MPNCIICRHPNMKRRNYRVNVSNILATLQTNLYRIMKADCAILIYMVGSDLETKYQMASSDIKEMMEAGSTRRVPVVLQTGGAKAWGLESIPADRNCRWLVRRQRLQLLQDARNENMDNPDTLSDFLTWSIRRYPARNYVLILWGHGLGPIDGFGGDEHYGNHKMKLAGLQAALHCACQATNTSFQVIGFDACSMAGLEIAYALRPYAEYMVASVDYTNHNGWDYRSILQSLQQKPTLGGQKLGEIIVNSYRLHSRENGEMEDLQMSVIRLDRIERVVQAVDAWGRRLLAAASDPRLLELMGDGRKNAEDYAEEADMADLADTARQLAGRLGCRQEADFILKAVEDAVVYNMKTPEHPKAKGLSIYFPRQDKERFVEKAELYRQNDFPSVYQQFVEKYSCMMEKDYNYIKQE